MAKGLGRRPIQPVEPPRGFGLGAEAHDLRNCGLHAEGQLIGADAGAQGGIVGIFNAGQAVEPAQQVELGALLFAEALRAGRGERQRIVRIDIEVNAVVGRAQIMGAVAVDSGAAVRQRRAQDHELRQVGVERAQAVMNPRADRRKGPLQRMPAGMELKLGAVVIVGRPHRADHGDVVNAVADVGPPIADGNAGLTTLAVADLERIHLLADVAIGIVRHDDANVAGQGIGQGVAVRGLGDGPAVQTVQLRLGIEAFHVAGAADHE